MNIYEKISTARRSDPGTVIHARRFYRRAKQHGVAITAPMDWIGLMTFVSFGDRRICINDDGAILQSSGRQDPHGGANLNRLHAHYLEIARRFRRHGLLASAREALDVCAVERPKCPPLPA